MGTKRESILYHTEIPPDGTRTAYETALRNAAEKLARIDSMPAITIAREAGPGGG